MKYSFDMLVGYIKFLKRSYGISAVKWAKDTHSFFESYDGDHVDTGFRVRGTNGYWFTISWLPSTDSFTID